jgi:hypothetical protein
MPQSTTALPTGPEQPQAGQPRVEIPATESEAPRPRRREKAPERDTADDAVLVHVDERAPKMEPWLWVLLGAVASATLALFVPRPALPALFVVTGALMLVGFVMLFVQERRNAARHRAASERRA